MNENLNFESEKYEYYNNILQLKNSIKSEIIKKLLSEEDSKIKEDNINNNKIINKFNSDKNMNNKINSGVRYSQNKISSNLKTNLDKNRLLYLARNNEIKESNKSYSKDNRNSFNKTSSYFSNLFKNKQGNS